jgi:hypothetical protein
MPPVNARHGLLVKTLRLTCATTFAVLLSEAIIALIAPSTIVKADLFGQTMMTPGPDRQPHTEADSRYWDLADRSAKAD